MLCSAAAASSSVCFVGSLYNALGPLLLSRRRLCNCSAKHTAKTRHGTNMLTLIRASGGYRQQSQTEMHEAMLPTCLLPACLPTCQSAYTGLHYAYK
ncbi:hypothetical protein M441DRAFT_376976 [Trichoderma asperellum CBS 433.97]|uniref:Uncharacterized protein n=1 Tax=Trichoderma asperellum (strain ATCC 204424 / CBS 433.97 / NBRC 101777) TaxID=1042311 RepID=A0A2T3ZFT4_TRIA4|nr:hypothetical protein M441DRAFT_376976 [Trichoderma asperellum CBS 433.97]PTB43677.1 hypothetical protein M441DRAFT_376976 [Trichoderma asperellum CBS 433.97]